MRRTVLLALLMAMAMPAAAALSIEGEVHARESAVLLPPTIEGKWSLTITQIAADRSPVEKGEVVVRFDANELMQDLAEKQGELAEKQRELEKLELDLAERARTEALATAKARAELEKAQRKTQQPQALIPGIEYRKLVIAREQAEQRMALMQRREGLAAEQRRQERQLLQAQIDELQAEVDELQQSMSALTLVAPRDGLMLHKSWNGEKFDVGSKVFRGQAVAEIPDLSTLAVRATLPERDLHRVRVDMPVRVVAEGGAGIAVRGRIAAVGRAVRSKSQVQPVPVLDLRIELVDPDVSLKPGQPVRVEIETDVGGQA